MAEPQERELEHLRALNTVVEELNRSSDLRTMLTATLETVCQVMQLQTAWAFLLPVDGVGIFLPKKCAHDFALAAAVNLPPGLERDGQRFLCEGPDCHCQEMLRQNKMERAVNIVECSRVRDSARAGGDNQGLRFHASVPLLLEERPVGTLNFAAHESQSLTGAELELLSAVGKQVSIAIERARLYDLAEIQRARLAMEMEMARAVQTGLLPQVLPKIPGFDLATHWSFAREVGGDFCDIFPLPGQRWGIVIADVSDKGAPAALYMALTRGLVRSRADTTPGPAALLAEVNHALYLQTPSNMFVTVWYGVLDPAARTLTYASAGHPPAVLRRASGEIEQLPHTGIVLGILEGGQAWEERVLQLAPGDTVVAYTDGLTDAENPQREDYSVERLARALDALPADAVAAIHAIRSDLESFTRGVTLADDLTLWAIRCKT